MVPTGWEIEHYAITDAFMSVHSQDKRKVKELDTLDVRRGGLKSEGGRKQMWFNGGSLIVHQWSNSDEHTIDFCVICKFRV